MRSSSSMGKVLALLVPIILTEQIYAQRTIRFSDSNNNEQTCPRGTRCLEINKCSLKIRSMMTDDPRECGYTNNWRRRICCPQREPNPFQEPRLSPQPSRSQPNVLKPMSDVLRPVPELPIPDVPIPRPEAPAPIDDVPRADNKRPIRFPGSDDNEQTCPRGTRCKALNRCFYRLLTKMTEEPKGCGYDFNGKKSICCPLWKPNKHRLSRSIPEFQPPRSQLNTSAQLPGIPRPIPKTPAPIPDVPTPGLEVPTPIADVLRPLPEKSRPILNNQNCGIFKMKYSYVTEPIQDWPWLVSVAIRGRSGKISGWCTGSMITRRHVVSAAHCFENRDPSLYVARIGHINQSQGEEYNISRILVPTTYIRGRFYDDIAILTLTREVNTEKFVPICLPPSRNFVNLTGKGTTVAGWGPTIPGGPLSESLRQQPGVPVISNARCETEITRRVTGFRNQFNRGISEGLLCAAFMEGGKDTCAEDSGAPLMYLHYDERFYLVGITSFGGSCSEPGFPTGFT